MPKPAPQPTWLSYRQIGMGGLNTIKDPQDLQDNESPNMLNTVYDDGIIGPRLGSILDLLAPVALGPVATIDSYNESNATTTSGFQGNGTLPTIYSQSFTGTFAKVTGAGFLLSRSSSGITGAILCRLYTDAGVYGVSSFPGTLLATSDPLDAATLPVTPTPTVIQKFTFSGIQKFQLSAGTRYCITVERVLNSSITIGRDTVHPTHSGNVSFQGAGTSTWDTTTHTGDLCFYVYGQSITNPGSPTQLMKAQDSHGDDYLIAVYGTQFYVRDPGPPGVTEKQQFILLNNAYTPGQVGLVYGYDTWHAGVGNDRFYFCNGVDAMMKWPVGIEYVKTAVAPADTSITLVDSTEFGSSGTLIIVNDDGTRAIIGYTANNTSTGVLTLSGASGATASAGNPVTSPLTQMAAMPIGKVVRVASPQSYARLFVANAPKTENTLHYSHAGDPEDFTISTDLDSGGSRQITKGEGGILDIEDFGEFLVVVKHNALLSYSFQINASLGAFIDTYTNLVQGTSLNPIVGQVNITAENALFMPTESEGIFQIVPTASGSQASTQLTPISNNIFDTIQANISFAAGRVELHHRKIYWLCTTLNDQNVVDPSTLTNDIVLVYDLLWNQWSIFDNWDAVDIREAADQLYFLSKDDGNLYHALVDYQDARAGSILGYSVEVWTKRFDFGKPAEPKTLNNPIYIEGYIERNTKLSVKVLYNEQGSLGQQSFIIDGSNPAYVQQIPIQYLGGSVMGFQSLGGRNPAVTGTLLGVFRVYLDASQSYGFFNIQLAFSTGDPGSNWFLGGIGFNLHQELQIPRELVISPSS